MPDMEAATPSLTRTYTPLQPAPTAVLTAIHIEDDPRSIALLKAAVDAVPEISLVQSFTSSTDALAWMAGNSADLVFLDIEMPERSGLEVAQDLAAYPSDIIFLTAHTGFAIQAFEACAMDYLVKPVYPEKLRGALERYLLRRQKMLTGVGANGVSKTQAAVQELAARGLGEASYPRRIFVSMVGEIRVLTLDDVLYFGASGPYTKIYLKSGEVVVSSESIKHYDDTLVRHPDFVRIHRSYLVSKQHVTSIQRKVSQLGVTITNGDMLPIAQQRRAEIFEQIAR